MKTIKLNQRILDYIIQAFFIFLSVFLAFWLNQYHENYKEVYLTTRAEYAILDEMKDNLQILEILHQKRLALMVGKDQTMSQLGNYKNFSKFNLIGNEKGFMRAVLSKSALSLINESRVNIDISLRQQLNKVYEHQQVCTKAENKLFDDFLNSFDIQKTKNTKASYRIFYRLLVDLWSKEVDLINSLKEAIPELEHELK